MTFDPGLARSGAKYTRQPYQEGNAGIRQSLDAMAQKMREGRLDPSVIGWAADVLAKKGLDGRDRSVTPAKIGAALLEALREQTIYVPDPVAAELVPSAAATLCLRPGLCLQSNDCDGLSVALGSALMAVGIPVQIVKQNFGSNHQEHVLIVAWDGDDWRYADPSTNLPFGSALTAKDELWVDPLGPVGPLPEAQPEIVTLGMAPDGVPIGAASPKYSKTPPHWLPYARPLQHVGIAGTPTVPLGGGYKVVTDGAIHAGLRYRFAVLLNFTNQPPWDAAQVSKYFSQDWLVESAAATPDVTGAVQSWLIQGIARVSGVIQPPTPFLTTVAAAVQSPVAPTGPVTPAAPPEAGPSSSGGGVPLGAVALIASALAAGGGYWIYKRGRR